MRAALRVLEQLVPPVCGPWNGWCARYYRNPGFSFGYGSRYGGGHRGGHYAYRNGGGYRDGYDRDGYDRNR